MMGGVCYIRKKTMRILHCHLRCCLFSLLLMQMVDCGPETDQRSLHGAFKPSQRDGIKPSEENVMGVPLAQSSTRREAELFLDHLFIKYGEQGVMSFEGFEHLLQSLGIGNVTIVDHTLKDHYSESGFVEFHSNHKHILNDHHGDDKHSHDGHNHGDDVNHDDHHHGDNHHDSQESGGYHRGDDVHESHNHDDRGKHRQGDQSKGHNNHNHGDSRNNNGHNHDDNHNSQSHNHDASSHSRNQMDKTESNFDHGHEIHHQQEYDHDHSSHHNSPTTPSYDSQELFAFYDFFGFADDNSVSTTQDSTNDNEGYSGDDIADYYDDLVGFADNDDNDGKLSTSTAAIQHDQPVNADQDVAISTTAMRDAGDSKRRQGRRQRKKKNKQRSRSENAQSTTPSFSSGQFGSSATHQRALDVVGMSRDQQERRKRAAVSQIESTKFLEERKCLTADEILTAYHIMIKRGITKEDFVNLCPAIVYQIDEHACQDDVIPIQCVGLQGKELGECITKYGHLHGGAPGGKGIFDIKPKVWGYAVLSVTVISLVGLFSVAIVPVMRKVFYNYLIQFLVALAIGSLTGDALLHLLPHAIDESHTSEGHDHESGGHGHDAVYKGLVVLFGIYFFFAMERFMDFWTERRQRKRKMKKMKNDKFYIPANTAEMIGEKLSYHDTKKRSVEDIVMGKLRDDEEIPKLLEDSEFQDGTKEEVVFEGHSKDLEGHGTHGHSHGDGTVPDSIAAIAWMVIMGDGLHNFSDGLAIGAAFANSITGGLSTSVAVFCHELPHELGDFAVLLRAGMSVKQALFYNIVSSVLCFVGMIIGVVIGNINEASLWIFALTAGIFIYISMVDMLPEITNPVVQSQESRFIYFLAQFLGISIGVGIMLVIALFEEKIRLNLDDSQF